MLKQVKQIFEMGFISYTLYHILYIIYFISYTLYHLLNEYKVYIVLMKSI